MSKILSVFTGGGKPPKPDPIPAPARPGAGESAFQAQEQRRRRTGATGYQSTLVAGGRREGNTLLGQSYSM